MSLSQNLKDIRDYLVSALITELGFPVSHEPSEIVEAVPGCLVTLESVEIRPQSLGQDEAMATFRIMARIAKPSSNLSDSLIEKATGARVAVLASTRPADVGYNPIVTALELEQQSDIDQYQEFGITYVVMTDAARS